MRKPLLVLIFIFIISFLFANENDTILLPYNATSLTPEQQESNPTILAYPTALKNIIPEMKCTYTFTIDAEGHAVEFSKGNLQYQASTGTWRFAEHQWDYVGDASQGTVYRNGTKCDNGLISKSYKGWIDLFGWATSGWNDYLRACYAPYSTSTSYIEYCPKKNSTYDLIDNSPLFLANCDWGVANQIGNDNPGTWRTLTNTQWEFIVVSRTNAASLIGKATVNGVKGILLLPDEWRCPLGMTFVPTNNNDDFTLNTYTLSDWDVLENFGAIFLPYAGFRLEKTVKFQDSVGSHYWTTIHYNESSAWTFSFSPSWQGMYGGMPKFDGCAVRLVKDVQ